ncbi:MAG: TonB-dependent receptor plug domain-containing protein, partial [Sphingomicrobium sp.]
AVAAQPTEGVQEVEEDGEDTIVVTGSRPRGSVVGDIPAQNVLGARDIRATGATSISELLDAVAAQTGSARGRDGGRPVLLLNGQRISGFRELRDLPPEAIERMEILPEEVALKYGYSADQRVVNIVLRRRFNSTSVELRGKAATQGDYLSGQADGTRLIIRDGQRTSLNAHVEGNNSLYENERDIALQTIPSLPDPVDPRPFRTLVGARQDVRVSGTANRTILGDVSATINGEVERDTGRSRFGVPTDTLVGDIVDPLARDSTTDAVRLGAALNAQRGKWRLSSTANAEIARGTTRSDQDLLDPPARDRSRSVRRSLTADATATGPVFALPAGEATATFKVGGASTDLDSRATRAGLVSASNLGRDSGEASVSLDLPITKRAAPIGRLSANANAGVTRLSDFGTLTTLGAGLNWSPAPRISLITSWTREEGAPSLQQLGDPLLETPGVRFFDFTNGETVFVTTVTGGNPNLVADRRSVFKVGGNWQPSEKLDLRLRAEYVRQMIDNPQASFPAASEALEAAFPDRFQRDAGGNLLRVDLRPVNFEQARRDTIRVGFDFTKPLKSRPPSAATIASFRQRFAGAQGQQGTPPAAPPGESQAPPSPSGDGPGAGPRGGRGGGFGGFGGGRFGGGNGGRLTFSLTDTITLVDRVTIADGLPRLDYLKGEAVGGLGGRSRHAVQVETGYYNNGLGARLTGSWRSGTSVDSSAGNLRFSPYADIDLRLFANLGERFDLVARHPFFRGTSVRLDIDNIFDNRPKVRDATGATPLSYQPGLIEPIGRTIGITFRKLFIPARFFQRGARGGRPGG